ncbi:MAG: alkaline phosphatase family protein [Actinomycetota bacterium]
MPEGAGAHASTAPGRASSLPNFDRVVVIVMENHEYGDVIGSSEAPYVNRLAHRFALATRFYGISHPSLPNYLALIGGSTFGIQDDCTDCSVHAGNLVDQLEGHHLSWKAYMQGMPSPCYRGAESGRYAKRHDPFMYFDDIRSNRRRCHRVVPFKQLRTDIDRGSLPRFVWLSPDLCHDGHDCALGTADLFLKHHVPELLEHLGSDGVLVLTWDEGTTADGCCRLASGGHIVTIVAGPGARKSVHRSVGLDHYSTLRTIELAWGLQPLRHSSCSCTRDLGSLLR